MKGQPTMVHVLLLRQVRLFKVIIRQTGGKLHQRSSAILIQGGSIWLSLRVVGSLAFGMLWVVCVRGR